MATSKLSKYLGFLNGLGDFVLLNIAFLITYFSQFQSLEGLLIAPYSGLFIYFNIAWFILVWAIKPYETPRTARLFNILQTYAFIIVLHGLLVSLFIISHKNIEIYSREQLFQTYPLLSFSIAIYKIIFTFSLRTYRKKGYNFRNIIIVGHGEISKELRSHFWHHREYGYKFLGFFDNRYNGREVRGDLTDVKQFCLDNDVNEIYCCLPYVRYTQIKEFIDFADANFIKVKVLMDFRGFSFKGVELEKFDHIPVLNITPVPLDYVQNRIIKRTFDVIFSFLVIVFVLSWLTPLLALLIRLDSKGPILFVQQRSGLKNEPFGCMKFRTMAVNRDSDAVQAKKDDMRITKIGAFLRKTSLDEMPQFFNVLLGDMSVVGPRPHMLKHTEEYSNLVNKFMERHYVKPGITGLAQAKGFRGGTEELRAMEGRVKLDRFYVNKWSIWLDIKVIILTVYSIVKGDDNAY